MIKKALLILSGYFTITLISACCSGVSDAYFEFGSAQVNHSIWRDDNNLTKGSAFQIILTDLEFVASNSLFHTSAYAMQPCPGSGFRGPKSPITKIDVSVNQTYFDTIPKGSNLNKYLYVGYYEDNPNNIKLSDYEDSFYYQDDYANPYLSSLFIEKNNLDTVHVFKFEIYQENGEKTTLFSNAVTW